MGFRTWAIISFLSAAKIARGFVLTCEDFRSKCLPIKSGYIRFHLKNTNPRICPSNDFVIRSADELKNKIAPGMKSIN